MKPEKPKNPATRKALEARHGQVVRLVTYETTEDVDGNPLGVETVDHGVGMLFCPWLDDEEDDTDG